MRLAQMPAEREDLPPVVPSMPFGVGRLHRHSCSSAQPASDGRLCDIVTIAIDAAGRRFAAQPTWPQPVVAGTRVLLDHAGPRAGAFCLERPVAWRECQDPGGHRVARALSDVERAHLIAQTVLVAQVVASAGATPVLCADDDGFWHCALRDPQTRAACLSTVAGMMGEVPSLEVLLCIDDLAPQGIGPRDGAALLAVLADAKVRTVHASVGSHFLPPLRVRQKGRSRVDSTSVRVMLSSHALLRHSLVSMVVYGVIRRPAADDALLDAAKQLGLRGVYLDDASGAVDLATATGVDQASRA